MSADQTKSSDDERLLQAVLKQVNLANIKLDYQVLAIDLGMAGKDPKGAASRRWYRYKEKHGLVSDRVKAKTDAAAPKVAKANTATPKVAEEMRVKPKKRKVMIKDEEKDDELED